ncbi:MAG: hypothetical protein WKF75_10770, partial [Singulisphaera sp.]
APVIPVRAPKSSAAEKPPRADRVERAERSEERSEPEDEANVDEVWTRWGEWGPTLMTLGLGGVIVVALALFAFSANAVGMGFLILLLGGQRGAVATYPIAVTMERPMRMTPEQALKDFYAAASHHFHTIAGCGCCWRRRLRVVEFHSFATFRATGSGGWPASGATASRSPPWRSPSATSARTGVGQTVMEGEYSVAVRARGAEGGLVEEVRIESVFVRGPDKMWYLSSESCPKRAPRAGATQEGGRGGMSRSTRDAGLRDPAVEVGAAVGDRSTSWRPGRRTSFLVRVGLARCRRRGSPRGPRRRTPGGCPRW